tara:strand:+ start:843 stop:1388 length:546 start_codon:yes stop_codon:yes gene_type:complete
MNDTDDYFLKQMKGVSPIKKNNRIENNKPKSNKIKNNKPLKKKPKTKMVISTETTTKKHDFKLENVNIKKSIKRRSINIDRKIDFHGKTLLDSETLFSNTIINCYNNGLRCLLFVTGKGLFKKKSLEDSDKPRLYHGVIRSALITWVRSKKFSQYILSYEPASIEHGGDGAFYIYLRKKKN